MNGKTDLTKTHFLCQAGIGQRYISENIYRHQANETREPYTHSLNNNYGEMGINQYVN
jgi:hypothetical protein